MGRAAPYRCASGAPVSLLIHRRAAASSGWNENRQGRSHGRNPGRKERLPHVRIYHLAIFGDCPRGVKSSSIYSKAIILIFQLPRDDPARALHPSIRVLAVYDRRRAGLAEVEALIGAAADMIVIGEANDGRTTLRLAAELKPDVIILDNSMLGLRRVKVVECLRAAWPPSKILLHILPEDKGVLRQLVELGVAGYLLKCSSADKLDVSSRTLMEHSYRMIRRMRYGTDSTRERHNDRGGPSSDTA
jgi:DNA-binding NarL/FixJ family response regulator